jgi:hypothetical protein
MSNLDKITPRGHLEIIKKYHNGTEELYFSERNTITSGMGIGLAYMFAGSGSQSIANYQIRYFQIGTSAWDDYGPSTYQLKSGITPSSLYSGGLNVSSLFIWRSGNIQLRQALVSIPFNLIKKTDSTSVQFTLILPTGACNSVTNPLQEIGLFMKNPFNYIQDVPILVAYKTFPPIIKTSDFSIIFNWTITF